MAGTTEAVPDRQIRAQFDDTSLIVYQAFPDEIADAALTAGTFVPPFKTGRMTWIKPSFRWMMYRSGWASKPGQERILAVRISRSAFEQALAEACLTHYLPEIHGTYQAWVDAKQSSDVRVQWDPERCLDLKPLPWRTIQVGLGPRTVLRYTSGWITELTDVTNTARRLRVLLDDGQERAARDLLPVEAPYPLPPSTARKIAAVS